MKTKTVVENGFKETEIGLIPKDWEVVKIKDVARVSSGGSAPQGDKFFNGKNPFIRVQHIEQDTNNIIRWDLITDNAVKEYKLKLFPKGTIVFPKSGASIYLEKRAMLPMDSYIVSHLCAVNSDDQKAKQKFLFYELKNIELSKDKADGYPTLNLSEVKNVTITLPPLPEQQKIASVLSKIQQSIEHQDKLIQTTKELKKSMMNKLFTEGLHGDEQKETEIGLIPKSWDAIELKNIVRYKIVDGVHKTPKYVSKGIPFITAKDIVNNRIDLAKCKYITKEEHLVLTKRVKPEKEDILLTKVGTIGNVALVSDNLEFSIFVQVALIKPDLKVLFPEYLFLYLQSDKSQKEIDNNAAQSTMKFIGTQNIGRVKIPLPKIDEQKEITNILSNIDKKIQQAEAKKQTLQVLFKTMLNQLMTGKTRVKDLDIEVN